MTAALAFAFAFAASLSWAGLDATRKLLSTEVSAVALVAVLSAGQVPLYLAWWAAEPGTISSLDYLAPGLLEVAFNVAANLLFVRAVEISPLSVTIPFLSFTPVFATAIAVPTLGELPGPPQLIGIGAVVLGALILGSGQAMQQGRGPFGILRALVHERGALFMLIVAALWAGTIAIDKLVMDYASLPVHALIQNGGVGVVMLAYLLARGRLGELSAVKRRPVAFGATVLFAAGGFGLQLVSLQGLFVGVVETLKRGVGLIAALVVGRLAFDEPIDATKLAACLIMAGGTAALMLG
jgi:drug/metabolite transporter (DMT)-like permease